MTLHISGKLSALRAPASGFCRREVNKKYKPTADFVVLVEVLVFTLWKSATLVTFLYGRSRSRLNICSASHFIHVSAYGYASLTIKEDSLNVWYDYIVGRSGFSSISKSTSAPLRSWISRTRSTGLKLRLYINELKQIKIWIISNTMFPQAIKAGFLSFYMLTDSRISKRNVIYQERIIIFLAFTSPPSSYK